MCSNATRFSLKRFFSAFGSAALLALALNGFPPTLSNAHAATIDVAVSSNRYTPNSVTINVGDTVRWTNTGGFHNVSADDGSFGNTAANTAWVFSRTFTQAGQFPYFCQVHSVPGENINTSMNGIVIVQAPPPPAFVINQGISGSWFNPQTGGQGFLMDVRATDKFIFVAWFTYERLSATGNAKIGSSEQRWLSAQGNYDGGNATLPVFQTIGGAFNSPRATTTTQVGTMTLEFTSCTEGRITFNLTSETLSGTIPIQRLIPGTENICTTLIPPAAEFSNAN